MKNEVNLAINELIDKLQSMQSNDGSWRFSFESGPLTDAYTIILFRSLDLKQEEWLIKQLANRLLHKQEKNGAWKLFHDEKEGNLSATVEAYFALLYSGYVDKNSENMEKAKKFILKQGGITNVSSFTTKTILALTGQLSWPKYLQVPIEFILLPRTSPINFYDFVGYARVHFAAILISSNLNYKIKTDRTPDLSDLIHERNPIDARYNEEARFFLNTIKKEVQKLLDLPTQLRKSAFKKAEQFILDRIEPNGLLFSYVSSTIFMIFALLSLGYPKNHPILTQAIDGIKDQLSLSTTLFHIENSSSTIWDTALLTHTLQTAGVPKTDEMIKRATNYLLSRQHIMYGDWVFNNPNQIPGGWGFSDVNIYIPDVDDTTAALRAIKYTISEHPSTRNSWNHGLEWVLSMQNKDGGWAAFEKNTDKRLTKYLPFEAAGRTLIDPSTTDLTGRTLEYLGNYAHLLLPHPQMEKAFEWLQRNQKRDGSWYGRWGISYIYGTWAAITGMTAIGVNATHPSIKRGIQWLLSIQNEDGGWGESCYSDIRKEYVPLHASTPSQTAWALDALIATYERPTHAIQNGISHLIKGIHQKHWTHHYPTGAGLPGNFYIDYHSYKYIWPLLALSNYQNKYYI